MSPLIHVTLIRNSYYSTCGRRHIGASQQLYTPHRTGLQRLYIVGKAVQVVTELLCHARSVYMRDASQPAVVRWKRFKLAPAQCRGRHLMRVPKNLLGS